jgi:topoisomerase-4 subunit B
VAFTDEGALLRESYVNLIPTVAGGTHESGLKDGCSARSRVSSKCTRSCPKGVKLMPEDVFSRASFVLSAKVLDPQFPGPDQGAAEQPRRTPARFGLRAAVA